MTITQDGPSYTSTTGSLEIALGVQGNEDGDRFVLATRHPEHGLSFWNDRDGFGRLRQARVFREAEAASFDVLIAHDKPEWLAIPELRA